MGGKSFQLINSSRYFSGWQDHRPPPLRPLEDVGLSPKACEAREYAPAPRPHLPLRNANVRAILFAPKGVVFLVAVAVGHK